MAAKKFNSLVLTTTQWTDLHQGQAGMDTVVTVYFTNIDVSASALVWLAVSADPDPLATLPEEVLFNGHTVLPNSDRKFDAVVVPAGLYLRARTDSPNDVTVTVLGFEAASI